MSLSFFAVFTKWRRQICCWDTGSKSMRRPSWCNSRNEASGNSNYAHFLTVFFYWLVTGKRKFKYFDSDILMFSLSELIIWKVLIWLDFPLHQVIESDFARVYISNVCVAEELHRNGLGCELIAESKRVAEDWGKDYINTLLHINILVMFMHRSL